MLFKIYYESLAESEQAHNCIKCNLCNKNCPQNLEIPQLLAKVDEEYKKVADLQRK